MITVSLTTTSERLRLCRMTLLSLVRQSRRPDRILLWVSAQPYLRDRGFADDSRLQALLADINAVAGSALVQLRWVDNTGPYRKLLPALAECGPQDLLVTADDDIFYGEHWLAALLQAHDPAQRQVVAARVRQVRRNAFGLETSYLWWPVVQQAQVLQEGFVVTFGGGAVLQPSCFRAADLASAAYLQLAPTADDLWFSQLLQRNGVGVKVVPQALAELVFSVHDDGLMNHNLPKVLTLLQRIRHWLLDKPLGWFGVAVCGNDRIYRRLRQRG